MADARALRVVMARFRRVAAASVCTTGVPEAMRKELEDEIVAHLLDAWDSQLARGLDAARAASEAIEAFGPPEPVRRRLLVRRLLQDARAATRLPPPWALFVVLDALAPAVLAGARH